MKQFKTTSLIIVLVVAVAILMAAMYWQKKIVNMPHETSFTITNFEECVTAGFPIMESYPSRCRASSGETFTQDIGNELEKSDIIRIDAPRPQMIVASPLTISGQARGQWFFEASFPARLLDANGTQLAIIPVTAQGEWMTTDFVPFSATMTFETPTTSTGTLILHKDNPSGLPEHDDMLIVPVRF